MSFVHQEDVLEVAENFARDLVTTVTPEKKLLTPVFTRITHHEAMEKYGSDKPDLRFDCHFEDFSEAFKGSGFSVFSGAIEKG